MKNKTAACLLLSVLLLSACSSQGASQSAANTSTGSSTSTTATTTENGSGSSESTTSTNGETAPTTTGSEESSTTATGTTTTGEQSGTSSESTTGEQAEAPATYTYHMDKNYNIIPNKESKETPKKVVLLTFDDGPKEKEMINSMMDTLDKHNAKAIFFVNGYRIKTHPELLKLIHDRGGIIGNHTQDHIVLKNESKAKVTQQIEDTQKLIEDTINESPRFLRAPNGATNDTVHALADKHHMLYMNWSVGSLDWVNLKDPDAVITNVMDQLHSGSIILMHELPWTVEALDRLLTKLEQKGYTFVDPNSIEPEAR